MIVNLGSPSDMIACQAELVGKGFCCGYPFSQSGRLEHLHFGNCRLPSER